MKPVPDKPIRLGGEPTLAQQLQQIPQGMYEGNRYDTDDKHVLHIWKDGKSYDITAPKKPYPPKRMS